MSEIKRVQLIPLGNQKDSEKPSKESPKTVRISVALPESTEDTCPEYNYKDELAAAKKSGKRKESANTVNGLTRLEDLEGDDDDDDVRRIARQMEEKYGTGSTNSKKKHKGRKDDYADIGMGYDESDSFIDNTDGYDEMIPQNVTTLHGGFYINSGALEFKTDDEANSDFSSSSSDEESAVKKSRKRIIESSDETDRDNKTEGVDENNHIDKKRRIQNGGNGLQTSIKKKLLGQNPLYIKKRRLLDPLKKTVKELLREKRQDLDMSIPEELDETVVVSEENKNNISSVSAAIESVVRASADGSNQIEIKPVEKVVASVSVDEEISREIKFNKPDVVKVDVKLPENLQSDILNVIKAIQLESEKNEDGKNYFTSEMNLLILRLERKCRCLGKPSKSKVYEYLAGFLKSKSESLIKRAKSLVLEDECKRLKSWLSTLKMEINKLMPSLLENYEKESQRVLQKKFSHESVENEEAKSLRMPKRRFQWNDITKKLLKDVVLLKKRILLLEGKSKENLDAQMTAFLKNEIQAFWPEGWMSMNALNKIYTTYADPKRLLNNGSNSNTLSATDIANRTSSTTSSAKNLPQSFSNTNLSITPIVPGEKVESINRVSAGSDVSVSKTFSESSVNLSIKSTLPEPLTSCDIKPTSPKKDAELVKVRSKSELLKSPINSNHVNKKDSTISLVNDDSVIIIDTAPKSERFSPIHEKVQGKSDDSYCQVIDLSDNKSKSDLKLPIREKTVSPNIPEKFTHTTKHPELSITPAFPKVETPKSKTSCPAGDDIQKVMENLKNLQKMSSPKKSIDTSPSSSAVSVIAVNKSFASKTAHESTMQRFDYKPEYNSSFQEEFQKQLFGGLHSSFSSTPSKNNYNSIDRYPHISTSGTSKVSGEKYFQNPNNNYTQSSNGHKSSTSTHQSGTYSILDDMFANLLTQYGYTKEATTPKSQPK